ncbi:hypothetical protein M433DRAFT_74835 [Acidomyces richmondensis BFW]|nr:MAG: hypothetical protein FE78DRAFT_139441 [Acidomyces sp. 'richmondensis']KYG41939.1 hypothetical protein M433DRAFT_74835 [Acidomyces richmondensis BFW]
MGGKFISFPAASLSRIKPKTTSETPSTPPRPTTSADDDNDNDGNDNDHLPTSIQLSLDPTANLTFADLGVDSWLVASLSRMAIRRPTRIQSACIPPLLSGRDCVGGSRTGSGKTVAFAVPLLQSWAKDPCGIFAVILTPTRELALQLYEQLLALGSPAGLNLALVTGGADMRTQALALARRPHVVVATPGRLAHHIAVSGEETVQRGLRRVRVVVLDEADRLLDPSTTTTTTGPAGAAKEKSNGSMLPDVSACLSALPSPAKRQTCLFTATITPAVRALQNLPRPAHRPPVFSCELDADGSSLTLPPSLRLSYQLVPVAHKEKYLHVLLTTPANAKKQTIVFCNAARTALVLEATLRRIPGVEQEGGEHRVTSLHAALPPADRTGNLARLRARAARIMVATDVAARGLDLPGVEMVINYDLPLDPDVFVHRAGRTARAGRWGECVSLVGPRDVEVVKGIESRVGRKMVEYSEEGVSVEGRVVKDGGIGGGGGVLVRVGVAKREALVGLEEGRDGRGKRRRGLRGLGGW